MKIIQAEQSTLPPPDKPIVNDPVKVYMDIPLYYFTERGPIPWNHPIYCGRIFADSVLKVVNGLFLGSSFGFVHLGFYNPRKARHRDGSEIQPLRWSNHAYGEAGDWKGIIDNDKFYPIDSSEHKEFIKIVLEQCDRSIRYMGRKPEIVDEGKGAWIHIGIWQQG